MKTTYIEGMGQMGLTEVFQKTNPEYCYRTLQFDFPNLKSAGFDKYDRFLEKQIHSGIAINNDVIALVHYPAATPIDKSQAEIMITMLGAKVPSCKELRWSLDPDNNPEAKLCRITIYLCVKEIELRTCPADHRRSWWQRLLEKLWWQGNCRAR
jgi:hypothetical protein